MAGTCKMLASLASIMVSSVIQGPCNTYKALYHHHKTVHANRNTVHHIYTTTASPQLTALTAAVS